MNRVVIDTLVLLAVAAILLRAFGYYNDAHRHEVYQKFADQIEQDFKLGMTFDKAKKLFAKYDAPFHTLECDNDTFSPTSCPGAFRTIMNSPLEDNLILGQGSALAYLYFDRSSKLESYELFIDYERGH